MQEKILILIEKRSAHWKRYQDSWNSDYAIPLPKEIDKLGKEILESIINHKDELSVDFALEALTNLGYAPNLVYDDNGHFAISGEGFSQFPEVGKFEETTSIGTFVSPEQWHDTIREALNHYINNLN